MLPLCCLGPCTLACNKMPPAAFCKVGAGLPVNPCTCACQHLRLRLQWRRRFYLHAAHTQATSRVPTKLPRCVQRPDQPAKHQGSRLPSCSPTHYCSRSCCANPPLPQGIKVQALPVAEADGLVWVWPGQPEAHADAGPPPPLARPPPGFEVRVWLFGLCPRFAPTGPVLCAGCAPAVCAAIDCASCAVALLGRPLSAQQAAMLQPFVFCRCTLSWCWTCLWSTACCWKTCLTW